MNISMFFCGFLLHAVYLTLLLSTDAQNTDEEDKKIFSGSNFISLVFYFVPCLYVMWNVIFGDLLVASNSKYPDLTKGFVSFYFVYFVITLVMGKIRPHYLPLLYKKWKKLLFRLIEVVV